MCGVECSQELPCQACIRSQAATTGRKSLRDWMQCVAFAIGDANLFALGTPTSIGPNEDLLRLLP